MGLHQSQNAPPTNAPLARRVSAFRVVHFDPGTVISIGGPANPVTLFGNNSYNAVDFGDDFFEEVWLVSGNVVIEYATHKGARMTSLPPEPRTTAGTSTLDTDGVVNVNGATKVAAANPNRRGVTIQNLSAQKVYVGKTGAQPASANAADPTCAVLAACGVAGDGTGGSVTLSGWSGDVWCNAGTAALVAVEAY